MTKEEIFNRVVLIENKEEALKEAIRLTSKNIRNDYQNFLKEIILGIGRNKKNYKDVATKWEELNKKWD